MPIYYGGPPVPQVRVANATDAGIRAAAAAAIADPNPSMIFVKPGVVQLTAPIPCVSVKTSWFATGKSVAHLGDVPDNEWYYTGGVVLQGDGTFACFQAQDSAGNPLDVDKASPDANFATSGISSIEISGFQIGGAAGKGFTRGFSFGAKNQLGLVHSKVHGCYVRDCNAASDTYSATHWAGVFKNCQHGGIAFSDLKSYNNSNGWMFTSSVEGGTLQCGNYTVSEIYHVPGTVLSVKDRRKSRGIVFAGEYDGFLNQVSTAGRIQVNRFGNTMASETATCAASTSVTVADSTVYQVGMPVWFLTTRGSITAGKVLFVLSIIDATHITVGGSRNGSALSGAAGTSVLQTWGMPNLEVYGDRVTGSATLSKVTNSRFLGVDIEGESTAQLYCENAYTCSFDFSQFGNTVATIHPHIVLRASSFNRFYSGQEIVYDADASSVINYFDGTITSIAQTTPPIGIYYDFSLTDVVLNLGITGAGAGLRWKNQSGGGFIKPNRAIGGNYTPWPYAAVSMNTGAGELVVYYSNGATTVTLPAIDSGGTATDNTGWRTRHVNFNTGILGVTIPGDIYDNVTGKTVVNLTAKVARSYCFVDVEPQIVNGTEVYLTRGIGTVDWTGTTASQLSNKATTVVCDALSGAITMNGAALNTLTAVTFTLTNSQIQAGDVVSVNHKSAGTSGAYLVSVSAVALGSCAITVFNCSGGNLSEAIVLQFKVHKVLQ